MMKTNLLLLGSLLLSGASAFVVAPIHAAAAASSLPLSMMDATSFSEALTLSSSMASSGLVLAETEAWVQPAASILDPFLNFMSFAMVSNARGWIGWDSEIYTDINGFVCVI
jgi:hypothetical protein